MSHPPLQAAELAYSPEGIPFSPRFDDIYHSRSGGLAQARNVFLAGNGLPGRWQGHDHFVICETGFGLGLSFLATWQAWRADPQRCARLHFISCELHPFRAADLSRLYAQLLSEDAKLQALAAELIAQWPVLVPGFHRLELAGGQVVLTLLLGDALHWLPKLLAQVDAFYLDGFAPAKNPQLWQAPLFKQFSRLAASAATLATYTVAGEVRRGLAEAGFQVERVAGFGGKRQMLVGQFRGQRHRPVPASSKQALIIGAGIAGASLAERLAVRGWHITLLEQAAGPASGASGNHAGAYRPVVSQDDNLQARLARAAFLYGRRRIAALPEAITGWCGALQLARHAEEAQRFARIAEHWPTELLQAMDAEQASQLAGQALSGGGLFFPLAGWLNPPSLVRALLAACGPALQTRYGVAVEHLRQQNGQWQALDADGQLLGSAPALILANAAEAARWAPELPLSSDTRVVSHLPASASSVHTVVCRAGYLTPAHAGLACLGSSPLREGGSEAQAHADNLALLSAMLPEASAATQTTLPAWRVCARPGTPDRLPIAGALADAAGFQAKHAGSLHLAPRRAGLYALTGFGARGLVWSGLLAEMLASQIAGEPLPIERELVHAVDPARFLARQAERG